MLLRLFLALCVHFLSLNLVLARDPLFDSPAIAALTSETLGPAVKKDIWIVEFYSPRCPHCRRFAPTFAEVAETFPNSKIHFANVDCLEYSDICDSQDINAYPTMLTYVEGKRLEEYQGNMDYESVVNYLNKLTAQFAKAPAKKEGAEVVVLNHSNWEKKVAEGIWFVKFFAPWCPHCQRLAPVYSDLSNELRLMRESHNLWVAEVNCDDEPNLCAQHGVRGYPMMKLFMNGAFIDDYSSDRSLDSMKSYLIQKAADLTGKSTESGKATGAKKQQDSKAPPKEAVVPPKPKEDVEKPAPVKQKKQPEKKESKPASDNVKDQGEVIPLSSENFDASIAKGPWIVEFFATWCGHCKALAPTWKELATELKGKVNVASVDSPQNPDLQKKFGIRGYPTIKFFFDGQEVSEFSGRARTLENLKNYALELAKSDIKKLSASELDALLEKNEVVFLFLSTDNQPDEKLQVLAKKISESAPFVYSSDSSLFLRYKVDRVKTSLLVLKDGKFEVFSSGELTDLKKVQKWMDVKKYPSLISLSEYNSKDLFQRKTWLLLAFLDPNSKDIKKQKDTITAISQSSAGTSLSGVLYAWVDSVKFSSYAKISFGLDLQSMPAIVFIHPDGDEFFAMPTIKKNDKIVLDEDEIKKFMAKAQANKLTSTNVNGPVGSMVKSISRGFGGLGGFASANPFVSFLVFCGGVAAVYYFFIGKTSESSHRSSKAD